MAVCGSDLQGLRFGFQAGSFRNVDPPNTNLDAVLGSHDAVRTCDFAKVTGPTLPDRRHKRRDMRHHSINLKDGFSRQPSTKAPRVSVPKMQGVRVDEPERENSQR